MNIFRRSWWLLGLVLVSCQHTHHFQLDLKKEVWSLNSMSDSIHLNTVDPGDVHLALMSKGVIPDPYDGDNELKVQWVGETNWCFETRFDVPRELLKQDHLQLVCNGLDTYADVWLNNQKILGANNMFRKWQVPVRRFLHEGSNQLKICFYSPLEINRQKQGAYGIPLPEERAFTRKAPYQFGWDWGPKLITMGVWKEVYLEAWSGWKLRDVFVNQQVITDSVAQVTVVVNIESDEAQTATIIVAADDYPATEKKQVLTAGTQTIEIPLTLYEPNLWYPNGMGDADLTSFKVSVQVDEVVQTMEVSTGLRSAELVQQPDEGGYSFYFQINGQPTYIKGANYIPQDNFLTRVSRQKTKDLLLMAQQSHINMLRVWGGGVYETDDFYSLCDSLGIMVWQDFMFAGTVYPGDSAFVENVKQEAHQQIVRLRNHPSIVLWCGNNEVDEAWHNWGWQRSLGYGAADSTKLWNDYLYLFEEVLPGLVAAYAPHVNYVPSSPANGWGREVAYQKGDVHYWGVWWGEAPFEEYETKVGRFVSEYGFQGMPDIKTIELFTKPEDRNLDSEVMASHQKHPRGKELIQTYMERDYKVPESFEDYVYVSQLLQARGVVTAIEAHRRARPYNMGTMYWQLNDSWPVTSWSGIDYNLRPKAVQYAITKAYDRFLISFTEETDSLAMWVVSDCFVDRTPTLQWWLIDFDGDTLTGGENNFELPAGSSVVATREALKSIVSPNVLKSKVVLSARVWDGDYLLADGLHYFVAPKYLQLSENPEITMEVNRLSDGYQLTLSSQKLAKNLWLQATTDGWWSDNYFDLLAGERVEVFFQTGDTLGESEFFVRSLGEVYLR